MILLTFTSNNEAQTRRFGAELGRMLEPGSLVLLRGELGAGKTCLSGAIAHGAGVSTDTAITSPTYTLMQEYQGRCPIYHFDLYRLAEPDELLELGFDEYLHGAGIALVEWPERYPELKENALRLTLSWEGEYVRTLSCEALGDFPRLHAQLCHDIAHKWGC
ncbi:MAG: tRNA (adenosine(37)-N6)-threonylcarbamoyltransferase complex ATPase subunit type 1 TsaE [Desulfuromonadaceae bacterium]